MTFELISASMTMVNVQIHSSSREAKGRKQCYPFFSIKSITFLGALCIAISVTAFQILGLGHPETIQQQRLRRSLIDGSKAGETVTPSALPFEVADVDLELVSNDEEIMNDKKNGNDRFRFLAESTVSSFIGTNRVEEKFIDPDNDDGYDKNRLQHVYSNEADEDDSTDATDSLHSNDDVGSGDYPEDEDILLSKADKNNGPLKDALKYRSLQAKEMAMRDLKTTYVPSTKYEHFSLVQPKLLDSSTSFSCQ